LLTEQRQRCYVVNVRWSKTRGRVKLGECLVHLFLIFQLEAAMKRFLGFFEVRLGRLAAGVCSRTGQDSNGLAGVVDGVARSHRDHSYQHCYPGGTHLNDCTREGQYRPPAIQVVTVFAAHPSRNERCIRQRPNWKVTQFWRIKVSYALLSFFRVKPRVIRLFSEESCPA